MDLASYTIIWDDIRALDAARKTGIKGR